MKPRKVFRRAVVSARAAWLHGSSHPYSAAIRSLWRMGRARDRYDIAAWISVHAVGVALEGGWMPPQTGTVARAIAAGVL